MVRVVVLSGLEEMTRAIISLRLLWRKKKKRFFAPFELLEPALVGLWIVRKILGGSLGLILNLGSPLIAYHFPECL